MSALHSPVRLFSRAALIRSARDLAMECDALFLALARRRAALLLAADEKLRWIEGVSTHDRRRLICGFAKQDGLSSG